MRKSRAQAITLAAAAGALLIGAGAAALAASRTHARRNRPVFDYSDRSGFPRSPQEMRGAGMKKGGPMARPSTATTTAP